MLSHSSSQSKNKPLLTYRITFKKLPKATAVVMKDYTGTHLAFEVFSSMDLNDVYLKVMKNQDVIYMTDLSRVQELELVSESVPLKAL